MDPDLINLVYPVSKIKIYGNGLELVRESRLKGGQKNPYMPTAIRGEVRVLSSRSLSRLAFLVRNTSVKLRSLLTLTYGVQYPLSGKVAKKHLNLLLNNLRSYYFRPDYVWFMEFQKRGAPHFHILFSEPTNEYVREWLAEIWAGIVTEDVVYSSLRDRKVYSARLQVEKVHLHKKTWENVREADGAARYVAKYAYKRYQKEVPKGFRNCGRFWGNSRSVKAGVTAIREIDVTDSTEAKEFVIKHRPDMGQWEVLPKLINTDAIE